MVSGVSTSVDRKSSLAIGGMLGTPPTSIVTTVGVLSVLAVECGVVEAVRADVRGVRRVGVRAVAVVLEGAVGRVGNDVDVKGVAFGVGVAVQQILRGDRQRCADAGHQVVRGRLRCGVGRATDVDGDFGWEAGVLGIPGRVEEAVDAGESVVRRVHQVAQRVGAQRAVGRIWVTDTVERVAVRVEVVGQQRVRVDRQRRVDVGAEAVVAGDGRGVAGRRWPTTWSVTRVGMLSA